MPSAPAGRLSPPPARRHIAADAAAPVLALAGPAIVYAHTVLAGTAFLGALGIVAVEGSWRDVCTNGVAGWPIEWFPSVSATIGDTLPARFFFHIVIALNAAPRFALIGLQWLVTRRKGSRAPSAVAIVGVLRTLTCGGWVYVTSRDQNDFHDAMMIAYIILTLPWMWGTIRLTGPRSTSTRPEGFVEEVDGLSVPVASDAGSPSPGLRLRRGVGRGEHEEDMNTPSGTASGVGATFTQSEPLWVLRRRRLIMGLFFGSLCPLIWFYVQHKVKRVPGAYTYYALLEWSLVAFDVAFDSCASYEAGQLQLQVLRSDSHKSQHILAEKQAGNRSDAGSVPLTSPQSTLFILGKPLRPAKPPGLHDHLWELPEEADGAVVSPENSSKPREALAVLSDIILAYCFWTTVTVLTTQLFYWSVWKLALSGSELALFTTVSPYLLSDRAISRFSTSRRGQAVLRAISVIGTLTAWALPNPLLRLIWVSAASAATWLGLGSQLSNARGEGVQRIGLVLGCGLVLTLLAKLANASNNPLWCILNAESGGWNKSGLALGVLALLEKHLRAEAPSRGPPAKEASRWGRSPSRKAVPLVGRANWRLSIGFGHLVFLIHTVATDAGTIIASSWTGYPVKGPQLLEHGAFVIASACAGFVIAACGRKWLPSSLWSLVALMATAFYAHTDDWPCFFSGCVLVAYVCSLLPTSLVQLSQVPISLVGITLGRAMLSYCSWTVVSTLTVSYAFVPGGWLFRERMDLVTWASVLCVAFGLQRAAAQPSATSPRRSATPITGILCAAAAVAFGLAAYQRASHAPIVPYHSAESRVWTGGIWAVHFGIDEEGHDSQRRMLDLIRDMEVDVIGLLETDLHRPVYGNRDLTRRIAEELGYYVDMGPGQDKHTWGAAMLSKFPIIKSEHHLLPSPHGELAPAIHAVLDIWGQHINVIVSHNGQEEDALDRELQSTALAKIMSDHHPEPFAFLGYLVTAVGAPRPAPYQIIMLEGKMWDVEIEDRKRWCQYIAFRNMWRVAYARVTYSTITDTELQVARWVLPEPDRPVDYRTNEELYHHWWEDQLPEDWRFTSKFRGNGTRGHTYEIFDGPIYYKPPNSFYGEERTPDQA